MAKLIKGILGGFSGKLGDVVGSSWNGIQVVKKLPAARKNGPTPAQIEHQTKFTLLVNFLKPISPILNKAFEKSNLHMTGFNKAFSNNQDAVTGIYPDFKIDYTKVSLCKRTIGNRDVVQLTINSDGKLILSLDKSSLYSVPFIWKLFFIAAYEVESKRWIYKMNQELNTDQPYELDLNPFHLKSVHIYCGFMPARGSSTISLYNGPITV